MARTRPGTARQRGVFDSVFKPRGDAISQPTPLATPATQFTAPGDTVGLNKAPHSSFPGHLDCSEFLEPSTCDSPNPAELDSDQVIWDRSWHIVTSALALVSARFLPYSIEEPEVSDNARNTRPQNFYPALNNLLAPATRLPNAVHIEDVTRWAAEHLRSHFLRVIGPWLVTTAEQETGETLLKMTFDTLQRTRDHHQIMTSDIAACLSRETPQLGNMFSDTIERNFRTLARNTLPEATWDMVEWYLTHSITVILAVPVNFELDREQREAARLDLLNFERMLTKSGLAGERFHIMVADVMHRCMSAFVQGTFAGIWNGERSASSIAAKAKTNRRLSRQLRESLVGDMSNLGDEELVPRVVNHAQASRCVEDVCTWTEDMYARLAVEMLNETQSDDVTYDDLQKWKEMSIGRLAVLRTSELFDIIVNWPNSHGALDDLRTAITTPQDRFLLTEAFTKQLKQRLLHAGASTLQILRTYIAMIRSFHALDHSKVLLDRVAFPLQLYLCSREDTARVVIAGLLADTIDEDGNNITADEDKLLELAILLHQGPGAEEGPDDDMDWDDMSWLPNPVDAGPGYKRSKSVDVIGTLINVLGSQEVFTKEFQKILGEHLLKNNDDFQNEINVLELLKARFGEDDLQSQEVMLKDIHDSRQLDDIILPEQDLNRVPTEARPGPPAVHAKILSRFFWPQLDDDRYLVPSVVSGQLEAYEKGFEKVKSGRKLTWLHALGQAHVVIDLKDRTITEEVMTFQATVLIAFQSDGFESATRTFDSLYESLQMDEDLLRAALRFWVGKMVLSEVGEDQYSVLETLSKEQRARVAAGVHETSAGGSGEDAVRETKMSDAEMSMYWTYVQGMLTDSAVQMPVARIGMMLKMLIADGFSYSDPELADYLNSKVESGNLELNAGNYKLARK